VGEIQLRAVKVEAQFPRGEHNAHVPDSFVGKGFRFGGQARRQRVSDKVRQLEVAFLIQRNDDVVPLRSRQHDAPGFNPRPAKVHPVFRVGFNLAEQGVPASVGAEGAGAAEDAVRVFVGRDVAAGDGVGEEQGRGNDFAGDGQDDIAGQEHLLGEELIGLHGRVFAQLHGGVVGTQFAKNHVKGEGFGALGGQFMNQPAVNLARPVKAEPVAEPAVRNGADALLVDEDKAQVGGDRGGKAQRAAHAHIVGQVLESLEEIQVEDSGEAHQQDDAGNDQRGDGLEGFDLHRRELNKKTRATQGCSGLGNGLTIGQGRGGGTTGGGPGTHHGLPRTGET